MNKKILASILLMGVLVAFATLPVMALAGGAAAGGGCGSTGGGNEKLTAIVDNVKGAAVAVGSGLAVVGFVVAGIMYVTAAGAPEKLGTAKKALVAAAIGAGLVALAQGANIMTDIFCKIIGA